MQISIAHALEEIRAQLESDVPVMITGHMGIGKSDLARAVGSILTYEDEPYQIQPVWLPIKDPVDMKGLPYTDGEYTRWTKPDFFHESGNWLYFFDEINAASQMLQVAAYQVILEKRIGENQLPKSARMIAAGNLLSSRAAAQTMNAALANRFWHCELTTDLNAWIKWALAHGIRHEIIAYQRWKGGSALFAFDPAKNENAFPTPRSWTYVSRRMASATPLTIHSVAGAVGEAHGAEFVSFMDMYHKLPDRDLILAAPATAPIPDARDISVLYALCGSIASVAEESNLDKIITYANRLPAEFSALLVRDCMQRAPTLTNTRPWIEWISRHPEMLA